MRYCNDCRRVTAGKPSFCNFCGASYTVKLCPRGHSNPRSAEFCAVCGSRELSAPARRFPLWPRLILVTARFAAGLALLVMTALLLVGFAASLFVRSDLEFRLMIAGLILGILWWLYIEASTMSKSLFHSSPKENKEHD